MQLGDVVYNKWSLSTRMLYPDVYLLPNNFCLFFFVFAGKQRSCGSTFSGFFTVFCGCNGSIQPCCVCVEFTECEICQLNMQLESIVVHHELCSGFNSAILDILNCHNNYAFCVLFVAFNSL